MNRVILNQILGTAGFAFLFILFLIPAIVLKDVVFIFVSIFLGVLTFFFTLNSIKVIKLEKGKKLKKDVNYNIFVLLAVLLFFFVFSLFLLVKNVYYRINGVKTNAIVYDVEENIEYNKEYDEEGNLSETERKKCVLYANYYVDNIKYEAKVNDSSCDRFVGDKVQIYYNDDNPDEYVSGSIFIYICFFALSFFSNVICVSQIIKSFPKDRKKTKRRG